MMVQVLEWAAWAPGLTTRGEWLDFFRGKRRMTDTGSPDVSGISPLLRRRMSRLTRMSVAAALDCCRRAAVSLADVRAVFASRHGEMGVTVDLLGQMAAGEPLSPMDFSGSVHHTAAGYFSIVVADPKAMRAVAGGEASFGYGFLDALGMLSEEEESPVLLVAADDVVPTPFGSLVGQNTVSYAAAFLLGRARPGQKGTISFEMPGVTPKMGKAKEELGSLGVPALDFLKWVLVGEKPLEMYLSKRSWRWQK